MACRIGNAEWKLVYASAGLIDIIQWILDFFAVGLALNEVLDPIIGVLMLGYFQLRGASIISKPKRFLSLVGAYFGEAVTDSIAPAWIIDAWYIHRDVSMEQAQIQSQAELMKMDGAMKPLYKDGMRMPEPEGDSDSARKANLAPLVIDGVRRPSR